jgi:DNA-binding transcriptional regulator YhcF (GntR family)
VTIRVDPARATPPSRQLVEAVLDRVAGGAWGAGERLPSVRGLAAEALVNPNTVGKAYRELEVLGVVEGRNGAGVFVTPQGPAIARAARRGTTLDALLRAIDAALEAGHEAGVLRRHVEGRLGAHEGGARRRA